MRIIIATGIFPPDIGGPATYLERLTNELKKRDVEIEIITYASNQAFNLDDSSIARVSRNHILPLRYFLYFWKLFLLAKKTDIIYAHDLFSCGLPAALVKKILRKKLIVRLGGDFLWEKAIARGWTKKPLREYYQQPKSYQEKLFLWIGQWVLKSANLLIFSTDWQKEIYLRNYKISKKRIKVIENPFPEIELKDELAANQRIIFAGRLIKLKNIPFLIRAFEQALINQPALRLEIIGEGPEKKNLEDLVERLGLAKSIFFKKRISPQQLIEEIKQSFLVVLPSLTEISPNLVLECIKLKKPILLTKETGLYEKFKDNLIFIDPFNQKDLENKIRYLLDRGSYLKYQEKLSLVVTDYSWPAIVKQHINIFKQIVK